MDKGHFVQPYDRSIILKEQPKRTEILKVVQSKNPRKVKKQRINQHTNSLWANVEKFEIRFWEVMIHKLTIRETLLAQACWELGF